MQDLERQVKSLQDEKARAIRDAESATAESKEAQRRCEVSEQVPTHALTRPDIWPMT